MKMICLLRLYPIGLLEHFSPRIDGGIRAFRWLLSLLVGCPSIAENEPRREEDSCRNNIDLSIISSDLVKWRYSYDL
jgi:hypothetical protein